MKSPRVSIHHSAGKYGQVFPYHPNTDYPEIPFSRGQLDPDNGAYQAVRETLHIWGGDPEHYGTPRWNPLGAIIKPGMKVTVVPNLLTDNYYQSEAIITHPSIIRAMMDYICLALAGRGQLTLLVTSPYGLDTRPLMSLTRLPELVEFYKTVTTVTVRLVDPRLFEFRYVKLFNKCLWAVKRRLSGDPEGFVSLKLGPESWFHEIRHQCNRLYAGSKKHVRRDFQNGSYRYEISRALMDADVVVSLPKLKTHQKSGVTLAVKGWVGIMTNRLALPHLRKGCPSEKGDQFPNEMPRRQKSFSRLRQTMVGNLLGLNLFNLISRVLEKSDALLNGKFKSVYSLSDGGWSGNDTIWRACLDLHRIVLYGDRSGTLQSQAQRRVFVLLDGLIGGEGEGPYRPDPVATGLLVAGESAHAVDCVATRLMGLNPAKVPTIRHGLRAFEDIPVDEAHFDCRSNDPQLVPAGHPGFRANRTFCPASGWHGILEQNRADPEA